MMKRLFITILCYLSISFLCLAQTPQVPDKIQFGDMELDISKSAQKDIQKSVDALHKSPKYFQILLEKVDMHFAVIEPILAQKEVPNDFKYLVIQESSLIGNAVSSSNAVGYWQFKQASGTELGLLVNEEVDERMNLYAATQAACAYWKRSNGFFKNWAYSLISYNTGFTGAKNIVDEKYYGKTKMPIDDDTHWYLKKFLAYKIAFQDYVGKTKSNKQFVRYYHQFEKGKSFKEIARETEVSLEEIEQNNFWLKGKTIPTDKPYVVLVPATINYDKLVALYEQGLPIDATTVATTTIPNTSETKPNKKNYHQINGAITLLAKKDDTPATLAKRGFVSLDDFLVYNDLPNANAEIIADQYYFISKKRKKTAEAYHTANGDESLWHISQIYGVRLKYLLKRNRMENDTILEKGRVVWLRNKRPKNVPVEIKDEGVIK